MALGIPQNTEYLRRALPEGTSTFRNVLEFYSRFLIKVTVNVGLLPGFENMTLKMWWMNEILNTEMDAWWEVVWRIEPDGSAENLLCINELHQLQSLNTDTNDFYRWHVIKVTVNARLIPCFWNSTLRIYWSYPCGMILKIWPEILNPEMDVWWDVVSRIDPERSVECVICIIKFLQLRLNMHADVTHDDATFTHSEVFSDCYMFCCR